MAVKNGEEYHEVNRASHRRLDFSGETLGTYRKEAAGVLIGEYGYSIDLKGRLNFPARLREDLGERFMIAKGLGDPCLAVYSMAEWEEKTAKIKTYPTAKAKELQRFLFPSAFEAEPDKQGRIVIPQNLREYAGLEKDVMVVGTGDRCEIWSKDEWERASGSISAESIRELVDNLGF